MMPKTAVSRVHHTPTTDSRWSGPQAERRLGDRADAFPRVFAWVDPKRPDNKTAAKFPHHEVRRDGSAGPANVKACTSGIGVLNGGRGGADIPAADRKAVYRHLAAHLEDAGETAPELEPPAR